MSKRPKFVSKPTNEKLRKTSIGAVLKFVRKHSSNGQILQGPQKFGAIFAPPQEDKSQDIA